MDHTTRHLFKHFLTISLFCVLMLGCISTIVSAEDNDNDVTGIHYYAYSLDEDTGQPVREKRDTNNGGWFAFPSQPKDNTVPVGKYVVQDNITIKGRVILDGDTEIILTYGKTLNIKGLYIPKDCTLTIYETIQNAGEWRTANIVSKPSGGAAIGGYSKHDNGNIIIHGGNIEAVGYDHCAGIGSNDNRTGGDIIIYNGNISVTGGSQGAGIGGGRYCSGGNITIYNADINATGGDQGAGIGGGQKGAGGNITIYDSNITATNVTATGGKSGAGIGGGDGGQAGNININGGVITASSKSKGAGIGGGDGGQAGNVTIDGGKITATGGDQGTGIGGGNKGRCDTITINDGDITATGGNKGAGIGGGMSSHGGTVTINGGIVNATGKYNAAGIGGSEDETHIFNDHTVIIINGGRVTATGNECGAGIGGGRRGTTDVTINAGDITATAGPFGAGIGSGPDGVGSIITIMGGKIKASSPGEKGCGIGNIQNGKSNITLGYTSDTWKTISITASSYSDTITLANDFESSYGTYQYKKGTYGKDSDVAKAMAGKTLTAALSYAVWVDPAEHGKVTLSSWEAPEGAKIRMTVKGDPGYIEDEIKVIRKDTGEPVAVDKDDKGNYSFIVPASDVTVSAAFTDRCEVEYLDLDGQMQRTTAYFVTDDLTSWEANKWYAVPRDTVINDRVVVKGKGVNLILCDGTTLNTKGGLDVDGHSDFTAYDAALTIWAQSDAQTNRNAGKLISAGIGGFDGYQSPSSAYSSGTVTINGGNIKSVGDEYAAGIGGGSHNHNAGNVIINAGVVDATAGRTGTAIGNARWGKNGKVTINGGTVTARSLEDKTYGIGGINSNRCSVTIHLTNPRDSVTSTSYHQCNLNLAGDCVDQTGSLHPAGTAEFKEESGLPNTTLRAVQSGSLKSIQVETGAHGTAYLLINGVQTTQSNMKAYPGDIISIIAAPKGSRSPKASIYLDGSETPSVVAKGTDFELWDGNLIYDYVMPQNDVRINVEFQEAGGGSGLDPGASQEEADKAITEMKGDKDPEGSQYLPLKLKSGKQTKTFVAISWAKPSNAVQYVIYGNRCGAKYKWKKLATVTAEKKTFKKIAGKKVSKGTPYKFIVVALDKDHKVVSASKVIHVYTKGGKYTNHKAVRIQVSSGKKYKTAKAATVKAGKTMKIRGIGVKANKRSAYKTHVKMRYASSNNAIATITSKGVIRGMEKGTCTIYAYSQNGAAKAIKLIVK